MSQESTLAARRLDYFDDEMTSGAEQSAPFGLPCAAGKGVFLQLQRGSHRRCAVLSRSVRVDCRVCAQHGRDVMGWESPVGVPTCLHDEDMITTSRRQGQDREGLFGGSRRANVRGDGQKLHRRPGLRASWHLMAKPIGCGGQGKCSACAPKHRVLTWGDLSGVAMYS